MREMSALWLQQIEEAVIRHERIYHKKPDFIVVDKNIITELRRAYRMMNGAEATAISILGIMTLISDTEGFSLGSYE